MNAADIFNILSNNAGVTALVGTRIYPNIIAQAESEYPNVVIRGIATQPTKDHDGPSRLDWPRFDAFCQARTRAEADALAEAARSALDGYKGGNIEYIWFEDDFDDYYKDVKIYVRVQEYKYAINRTP